MLAVLTLSALLLSKCYSSIIVEHNDIGIIEHINIENSHNGLNTTQDPLARRLMPGGLTTEDKLKILQAHNRYRTLTAQGSTYGQPSASNMNQLMWDEGLAKVAQDYSGKCSWAHNSNRNNDMANNANLASFNYPSSKQPVGENLFLTTGAESIDSLLQGIQYWYNEYTYYTYGTMSMSGSCQSGQQCGHYTQLIWGNTRYVGCGYTKCPSVSGTSFSNAVLFVCNYYFAGNIVGTYPYKIGSPAASCGSDRSPQNGLCSGCPSPYWDTYCCEYCSTGTCTSAKATNLLNAPSSCTDGLGNGLSGSASKPSATTTTPKPTNSPTPKPVSSAPQPNNAVDQSNQNGCCTIRDNNRYSSFCRSISYSGLCEIYSGICDWDDSC